MYKNNILSSVKKVHYCIRLGVCYFKACRRGLSYRTVDHYDPE